MGSLNPDCTGETVVVTGAGSGICREAALRFGEAGANVDVGDLAPEPEDADVPTHEAREDARGSRPTSRAASCLSPARRRDVTGELLTIDGGWSVF